jgi:hypothetical protein
MKPNVVMGTIASSLAAVAVLAAPLSSGLKPGENVTPFHPKHLAGPLAGTTNCFPCTFQQRPQVQVWVNGDSTKNVNALATTLSKAMKSYSAQEFKGLVVFLTTPQTASKVEATVKETAKNPSVSGVDLAVIDTKNEAIEAYNINTTTDVKNTVIVYKNWKVANTFVNLTATDTAKLESAIAGIAK